MRNSKKEMEALRGRPPRDKKNPYKGGIAHRLRMKKKKVGKKAKMAGHWEEEQHLYDLIERTRMKGSSLKLDVIQKVLERVVNERMSQGERVKDPKEKKKVPRSQWREKRKR